MEVKTKQVGQNKAVPSFMFKNREVRTKGCPGGGERKKGGEKRLRVGYLKDSKRPRVISEQEEEFTWTQGRQSQQQGKGRRTEKDPCSM